ncbi:MAG TPA: chorismate mutase [Rhodopila sp.]|nr:chorismate mutase [Rhodopila sp.]
MSISVSTADASPAAPSAEDAPTQDGWRNGGLAALRGELDRIDNTIHDLLMQRAEVVEHVGKSGKPAAFRPGREASILRRLLARHRGSLPPVTLVRIWREMLAGTTSMQGGFSLAVADPDPGAALTQLAREHFGALTPLRQYGSPGQAMVDVSQSHAAVAVLPYPSETDIWWVALLHHEPRLHIIARLPFWQPRPEGMAQTDALVVAGTPADASGEDRSFLGLECDSDVSRTRLSSELATAGLKPETLVLLRPPGSPVANVLVEVDGFLADDDVRLSHLGSVLRRPVVLGNYAVPISGGAR